MEKKFKFKVSDRVRKVKGYKFEGVVISAGTKLDGERVLYSVEVGKLATIRCGDCGIRNEFDQNCGGMVHIFAEGDLELIEN